MNVDELGPDEPYRIQEDEEQRRAVVWFAVRCDHPRTKALEDQLANLVASYDRVACEVSRTRVMGSDWLRWLARLTARAKAAGKVLALVGMGETLGRTADVLGLQDELVMKAALDEVWAP
ncbi:MAG TPA: STAS domain-containing protein [Thermoanaerobaculia bacterium]|nr:STAS domain-containing protein [Thermoanaerobaculia bacterium]